MLILLGDLASYFLLILHSFQCRVFSVVSILIIKKSDFFIHDFEIFLMIVRNFSFLEDFHIILSFSNDFCKTFELDMNFVMDNSYFDSTNVLFYGDSLPNLIAIEFFCTFFCPFLHLMKTFNFHFKVKQSEQFIIQSVIFISHYVINITAPNGWFMFSKLSLLSSRCTMGKTILNAV